ncbi:hypothetical protein M0R45_028363 [Rubus argutus]|uniref:Uncharacterized protein n=1 Tax=Rubus argutus TaxID=59490 RepID=A0AAW1W946_RUBAR
MFQRVISCYDFSLSDEHHSYELYAPNHFARQLGFRQEVPFPLFESLNRYSSWRLKSGATTLADEADRYSVRFEFASMHFPPPIRRIVRSKEHSSAYLVFWNMLQKADWQNDAEDKFRSIFARGNALLGFAEDQRVLNREPGSSPHRQTELEEAYQQA